MPPSHRSSGSHSSHSSRSSSSHSSRSSSSYRSSSSSYRSSSSRGPGSRSSTSHSSTPSRSVTRAVPPPPRPRRNQPGGYERNDRRQFQCRTHDYVYYPIAWTVGDRTYDAGYYDEEGNHYDSVAIKNEETICKCEYCGSLTKIKWDGGALPNCEHCGAPLSVQVKDEGASQLQVSETGTATRAGNGSSKNQMFKTVGIILAVWLLFQGCSGIVKEALQEDTPAVSTTETDHYDYGDEWTLPESYYAAPIGRTCYLEDDCYVDEETQCWFCFNEEMDPPIWQYWFEGVSSDYGDYGWMEYDDEEQQWYIETESGWIVLPSSYDTSGLWHFDNANTWEGE